MKFSSVLPLTAALATALVMPDEQVMNQIAIESHHGSSWESLTDSFRNAVGSAKEKVDEVYEWAEEEGYLAEHAFDANGGELLEEDVQDIWEDLKSPTIDWFKDLGFGDHHGDHDQPPPPPHHGEPDHDEPDHKKPHHGKPHHHKPNQTVYQLISKSKYTTELTKLVNRFPEVVEKLNGTEANFTFFAPTNKAFEKIPKHGKEPSKEFLLKVLQYHVVPDVYPAGRVLKSRTLPTVLEGSGLSSEPKKTPQRLSVNLSFKGLTLNFYSRVIAVNIFGTNGIIHGVDTFLIPPPKAVRIIQFLPAEFSTLELALYKTGLIHDLNDTSSNTGGTLFAPDNRAFETLGPKANAFLFSKYGEKYLKALLKYHIVPKFTVYSDALYTAHNKDESWKNRAHRNFHIDLPTALKDKYLSVDIAHLGRIVDIRINGFSHVKVTDGVTYDGVLHVPYNVLIPPKNGDDAELFEDEIEVADLVERLQPFVEDDGNVEIFDDEMTFKGFNEVPLEL